MTVVLSARQRQVADMLVAGHSVHAIAHELVLSENSVKTHSRALYRKLGLAGRCHKRAALWDRLMELKV